MPQFIGVVVNPKTKRPVYVEANQHRFTVYAHHTKGSLVEVGRGYLDVEEITKSGDYAVTAELSGYPRVHCPSGVEAKLRKRGYGTALYTGAVLLATSKYQRRISLHIPHGNGEGVSSATGSRTDDADDWWDASVDRGLANREDMSGTIDVQSSDTRTDVDASDYLSPREWSQLQRQIERAIYEAGVEPVTSVGDIRVTVDVEVDESNEIDLDMTVDTYTLDSAVEHGLVAVINVQQSGVRYWGDEPGGEVDEGHLDVILALDLTNEPDNYRERFARIAEQLGATEEQVRNLRLLGLSEQSGYGVGTYDAPQYPFTESLPRRGRGRSAAPALAGVAAKVEQAHREQEAIRARMPWDRLADLD